jgi:formylglycine-generating enzyme required for sulfatase activity/dienelactone hydrolase
MRDETVSHYRIVEQLGGGGMGVVYKAVDTRLNRFVALKFLSSDLTKDPDANARFIHEAQAASALDHPNICTIHEIDATATGELFLTMAFYEGETLKQRIDRGPLTIEEVVEIAIQVARALSRAHEIGLVHRDVKPANVMIASDGLVKILDFGLAKLAGSSELTRTGITLGTVAYMSPEQIRGGQVDVRTDIWSTGVVLYEMLTGRRPFDGKDDLALVSQILDRPVPPIAEFRAEVPHALQGIVARALSKEADARYSSATELLKDLTAYRDAAILPAAGGFHVKTWLRKPGVAVAALAVLVAISIPSAIAIRRSSRAQWARNEGIPQILQLVARGDYAGAFDIGLEVERYLPDEPLLESLWDQFSRPVSMTTTPAGADVYVQPYIGGEDRWERLGRTPISNLRLPYGSFRFRIEKAGFQPLLLASRNPGALLGDGGLRRLAAITMPLLPTGQTPEMVPVPGGAYPVGLTGFESLEIVSLESFLIDRTEVTNQEFKRFVDAGGYRQAEFWKGLPVVKDGRELSWPEAASLFLDSTGRPGPATWELGEFLSGQSEYPVGGVSWYEAAAYCGSLGKTLPGVFHWARAASSPIEIGSPLVPVIVPGSNFSSKGPVPAGSTRAIGPYGTYDMAGNVREWIWNEAPDGRRWSLGGAWDDQGYMFGSLSSLPPLDRDVRNGFRCARLAQGADTSGDLFARVDTFSRDNRAAKAVSDEVFEVFRRQFQYESTPVNARVESRDESRTDWVREKITFDAGYETGRVPAYLFLPRAARPPYQLVVYFPGVPIGPGSSENTQLGQNLDYIVKSGRAVVYPVYKGFFERWDPFLTLRGEEYERVFRNRMNEWRQDVGKVLDILSAREDIDGSRIAYYGLSFGASAAFPLVALDDRFKVAVLGPAGFTYRRLPAEADPINYVSRVTIPVLMLGGRHDYIFPLETSQKPMFDRLGTPADQKRHVVFESGHVDFPRSELIREVLGWLDRHLGPVGS